jgi:hypothetical protein
MTPPTAVGEAQTERVSKRRRLPLTEPQREAMEREVFAHGRHVVHARGRDGLDELGVMDCGECVGTVRRRTGGGFTVWLSDGREVAAADAEAAVRRILTGWA